MIVFKHVLCPIDFSETSMRALTAAVALAGRYGAELEVLHVVPEREHGGPPVSPSDRLGPVRQALTEARADPARTTVLELEGRAHERIAARVEGWPADLLVMGTHGRSGFNRLLLGSVAEKVLHTVRCPVLTVPPSAPTSDGTFKRILCATDFSPSAEKALNYALQLGRESGGCVSLLYALEYLDPEEPCEHIDFDIRARRHYFVDHARARLHELAGSAEAIGCEVAEAVAIDRAYRAILQRAAADEADLIVMGAQGTAGLELAVYGSNTQHVVRAAVCPVLTVHV